MKKQRTFFRTASAGLVLTLVLIAACDSEEERPPFFQSAATDAAGGAPAALPSLQTMPTDELYPWCSDELDIDTSALCEDQTSELGSSRPNLYFVLDTSGSMAGRIKNGQTTTLLDASRQAIFDLVAELGDSLNYGIATFPGELEPEDFGCAMGEELLPPLSDQDYCASEQVQVQFNAQFKRELNLLTPKGGTPLSPTLRNLEAPLLELQGTTTVVLLTDGAPNCNTEATCEVEDCLLPTDFFSCGPTGNCCAADATSAENPNPGSWCIDEDSSVAIVAKLAEQGIQTRVIGIPGAQEYEPLMNALAQAGGAARSDEQGEESSYFDVSDSTELLEALRTIGQGAATDCDIKLDATPADASLINVYVNNRLVTEDAKDGWELSERTISLKGDSCILLREGGLRNVRIVVGCPTIIR